MLRPKVLYITRAASGGMSKHLEILLQHFSKKWVVGLVSPLPDKELVCYRAGQDSKGIFFYKLPLPEHFVISRDFSVAARLLGILRKEKPDLLHVHGYKTALVALPAAYLAGVPVILTVHNYLAYPSVSRIPGRIFMRTRAVVDPLVSHYITVSEALRQELISSNIPPGKISTVYNGINPFDYKDNIDLHKSSCTDIFIDNDGRNLEPLRNDKSIAVGTAGRLVFQKGVDLFLRAAAEISHAFPHAYFFIAGEGPERENLELLSKELCLEGQIVFLGKVDKIFSFFKAIDIFVLASRSEGLSISLLEAGAAGIPLVAAASGGIPEIINHGENGLLVPPEDYKSLASAIALLLEAPGERRRMGLAAEQKVFTYFTEEKMVSETEKLYEKILCNAGGSNNISSSNTNNLC